MSVPLHATSGIAVLMVRESIDICPGWGLQGTTDETSTSESERGLPPSPLTVIFGGNGAGKSAIFDAVLFVLGQVISFKCWSLDTYVGDRVLKPDMGVRP